MEKLTNIQRNVDLLGEFDKMYQAVISVAKDSIASNSIKVVVLGLMAWAYSYIRKQIVKHQIEEARKLSELEKQRLREYLQQVSQTAPAPQIIKDLEAGF